MVNESGNSARNDGFDKSPEEFFDRSRKEIEKYFIIRIVLLLLQLFFFSLLV